MDNQFMTPEQLAAIRARAEVATAGPWIGTTDPSHFDADCVDSIEWSMYVERRCDREFIAHARADIPALLDHIERLQAKADALVGLVRDAYDITPFYYDDYTIGDKIPFDESDAAMNLFAILNGAGNESEGE